ncbi:hypothetical protein KV112_08300 [Mycolicibacter sp. MYC123]|uniref:DUF4381 domain-containing protein n=1 Tax=[Mycobacterium] zoologicum TaxID=2872311 RepID=A0ABU5YJR5_9MYCO|nr:hypothetical protein [Mycolicibacter sp. MYC123]MEB3049734.1 hypothetical protein [Mycolicibacter sp. MYC123]
MPTDDLLRFIGGPLPFSAWWIVFGVLLVLAVIAWLAGVFVWTLPPSRLRRMPVVRTVHAWLTRRRFTAAVRTACGRYQAGGVTAAQASTDISRTVRSFLYVKTGIRAQYLHVDDIADGPLAPAAALLAGLNVVRFDPQARADVAAIGRSAEELISTWT